MGYRIVGYTDATDAQCEAIDYANETLAAHEDCALEAAKAMARLVKQGIDCYAEQYDETAS